MEWNKINQSIFDHFDKIIEVFGLDLMPDREGWVGTCPIHNGDNKTAFRVFPTATAWCFTRGCLDGRCGMLDLLKLLIEKHYSIECDYNYACAWYIDNILNGEAISDVPVSAKTKATYKHKPKVFFANTEEWYNFIQGYPSENYIKLGFDKEIVQKFFIGECHSKKNKHYNRIVVPQLGVPRFDQTDGIIGYTGRSLYPVCPRCGYYHSNKAPCPTEHLGDYSKWKHSWGWKCSYSLYALWEVINTVDQEINVVESVGNTLHAHQAGFINTVGLFGNKLSQGQATILEEMGIKRVNWIIDNDINQAGMQGATKAQQKYKQFKFRIITPPCKDIAEMTTDNLKMFLKMKGIKQ